MPIIVKDYRWEESDKSIFITVPLKGVKSNKVDIFSTEEYIKVSFPPYIFECFLNKRVKDTAGSAQVGNGVVLFKLEKEDVGLWEELHHPNKDDKAWQRERREEAQRRVQERAQEAEKLKAEQKRELERFGVKQQMNLEDADRQRIEDLKNTERQKVTQELDQWSEHHKALALQEQEKEIAEKERKLREAAEKKAEAKRNEEKMKKKKASEIFKEEAGAAPIRQGGNLSISFTPRVFPTPQRESLSHEEEAWLKKQADARRTVETFDADLTEEEKNPVFLKDKADNFFKAGNLQAAVNAYTTAIRLSPKLPSLYSNRAACHLKLTNLFKCAEDCTKALELLTPAVPQNAASRLKAHVRRGTAYAKLELYVEGLQDYDAALKIDPNNEQLKADAQGLRDYIQTSSEYT